MLDFEVGLSQPLFLIAGPCVIESEQLAIDTAGYLKEITTKLGINFIYKSTYHRNLQKLKLKNLDFLFAHKDVLSLHSEAKLYRNVFDQCSIRAPAERALASITNK